MREEVVALEKKRLTGTAKSGLPAADHKLQEQIALLRQGLFGRKSEQTVDPTRRNWRCSTKPRSWPNLCLQQRFGEAPERPTPKLGWHVLPRLLTGMA